MPAQHRSFLGAHVPSLLKHTGRPKATPSGEGLPSAGELPGHTVQRKQKRKDMRTVEDLLHSVGPDRGSVSVRTEREGAHSIPLCSRKLPTLPEKLSGLYCNEQTEVNKPVYH